MSAGYTHAQYTVFRVVFGVYLLCHFATLTPYAVELYSGAGMLPDASVNLTAGYFPNALVWCDSPRSVYLFFSVAITSSLMLLLGRWPRCAALFLFYALHCLYHRNNLTHHLGVNYVGWLLLVVAVTPHQRSRMGRRPWVFPRSLYVGGWIIFGLSYTISGLDKLQSPHWVNGEAISYIARSPETSAGWPELILWLPDWALRFMTWVALTLETLALPAIFFTPTRRASWVVLLGMHIGIMLVMGFYDLTAGILCFYLLLMDPSLFTGLQKLALKIAPTHLKRRAVILRPERAQRRDDAS